MPFRKIQDALPLAFVILGIPSSPTTHADTLPYTTRTQAYSGWNTSVSGDVRTVGMAGATVGLPDTFLSSTDNPAGMTMLLIGGDDTLVGNSISDRHVQNFDYAIKTNSFGVAVEMHPWGFSAGYITTSREGQPYTLPSNSGQIAELGVSAHEYRLGISRSLFQEALSIGANLNIGVADEQINPGPSVQDTDIGATFGALVRLPRHWIAGISYAVPMRYTFSKSAAETPTPQLPGFFQPLISPLRMGVGAGWIPNRFFRYSLSFFIVGTTLTTSLLRDDADRVGRDVTLQPRMGASYIFADFKELKGTLYGGTYLEMTRIQSTNHRVHLTSGIELNPWVLKFGLGADLSAGYSNYIFGFGVDVLRLFAKIDLIPTAYRPPHQGIFPNPQRVSDEGLPRSLVKNWRPQGPDMNPISVIKEVPERAEKSYEELKEIIHSINPLDTSPSPASSPSPKLRRRKKRRAPVQLPTSKVPSKR